MENSPHHISSNYKAIGPHAGANRHNNNTITPHEKYIKSTHHISSNYKAIGPHAGANHYDNNTITPHGKSWKIPLTI